MKYSCQLEPPLSVLDDFYTFEGWFKGDNKLMLIEADSPMKAACEFLSKKNIAEGTVRVYSDTQEAEVSVVSIRKLKKPMWYDR